MAFFEVKNLDVYYDNIRAVKGITFKVNKGEIVSIIGANGAGKTTTLQTISGIKRANAGSIAFDGRDITKERPDKIVKYGLIQVPEGRRIFQDLTVEDNLKLGGYSINETKESLKEKIEEYYLKFPVLKERKDQLAGTLSGGEQQMLAIGRAVIGEPKLLLLDEPSMGLSPLFTQKIFDLILELNKEKNITILLVEQNANKALEISDRAYVIETGNIILKGSGKELKEDPKVKKAYLGA